ncbi:glycosyltransferase family 4 protein [Paenibacillus sp. GYB004]|uniref:glycosyltransferase family 4 protein n=1 Tax=Paenibacillus sp. GYB004 TaxID=2994393 RepID=UPI002F96407A
MDVKHICFVAEGYPTDDDPRFTFVRQLICSIADLGVQCSVIVPQSITNTLKRSKGKRPYHWTDSHNSRINIFQPKYISFSNIKIFGVNLSHLLWRRAVIKTYKKLNINPDILYGHFWHCGVVASMIGQENNLPVFVASGESRVTVQELYKETKLRRILTQVKGVICVSSKNKKESIDLNLTTENQIQVIPNAIDNSKFYLEDKLKARRKLGFQENDFIVAFTGAFNNRKGVLRLSEAVQTLKDVKSVYIGSGELIPKGEGILFCGKLPHDQIVHYLNAADVFVLPTLAEGCCNAIIEAMACGLPIVSSDQSFNDDILNEQNSIRIDSNDIDKIADAVRYLKDNPQIKEEMSLASLSMAKGLDIQTRAKNVIHFIEKQLGGI